MSDFLYPKIKFLINSFLCFIAYFCFWGGCQLFAQPLTQEVLRDVNYSVETQFLAAQGNQPFWFTANKYGRNGLDKQQGLLRLELHRPLVADSDRLWRVGGGLNVAVGCGQLQNQLLQLQEAYLQLQYRLSRFTLGQREQPMELVDAQLSTGAMVFGINARPLPMLRYDIADWWHFLGQEKTWLALKGHIAYGLTTDGKWQEKFVEPPHHYSKWSLQHQKAGYMRFGDPERHPVTFIGGLEMATQFAGTIYRGGGWGSVYDVPIRMGYAPKDFFYALIGKGGSDVTDGNNYENSAGNTLGAWRATLEYQNFRRKWGMRLYYDHYFDDQSAAFDEYGWIDGLFGVEIRFPDNPVALRLLCEYMRTDYQSGPIYHDKTPQVSDQVSGVDNYYNHNLYPGWQYYGMSQGNSLFTSPLYENNGNLAFLSNRFRAWHVGVAGRPHAAWNYRLLYTQIRSWGTYAFPFEEVQRQHSFFAELDCCFDLLKGSSIASGAYKPRWTAGWRARLGVAFDRGIRVGNNFGVQLTFSKTGLLTSH